MATCVPDEGDIVWLNFTPQSGHEQTGRRPAVVLSPKAYNQRSGLLVCVPITSQIKGYPFEVVLSGSGTTGAALADQVKSLDWKTRQAERKGQATPIEMAEIKAKIKALLKLA
ncbi:endoribonuclease MazF [Nitrosomonas mobilis]|uniref:mRNA interferase n=1 Tax=Nitrosomonas mobilis TaxID=51642 RepID=A0A1G5SJC8_9PROT|nr:endoribonuclease MazF [Nitrosomonas mobilis]SCZ86641.1 toxin of the ChpA-ChpR toxin-antitoxin system, endoribonuclease [Nitrosomonas mobilis]